MRSAYRMKPKRVASEVQPQTSTCSAFCPAALESPAASYTRGMKMPAWPATRFQNP